jgi:deoxyribodipyrimidine photo-lyase
MESRLHTALGEQGVTFKRYPGALLFEPEDIHSQSGQPFRVFTPFWKHCLRRPCPAAPLPAPGHAIAADLPAGGLALDDLALTPRAPDWAAGWPALWAPGTAGALAALERFLEGPINDYDEGRNHPERAATSRLSPHMHFGELSARQLWHRVQAYCATHPALDHQRDKFLSELGWREFCYHLLHHFPAIVDKPFRAEFEHFPWLGNEEQLTAWQQGMTGYPLVDAGMRELWHTGYMHNRVRMVTASFLTKHLLVHWRRGEAWFRDTLVDADLASNTCGWQWVAGSGADAAPYFRIFNPTLQGTRFDAAGTYVRRWVPELAALPDKHIHEPAAAPADVLAAAGVSLGDTYPRPIVDHRAAREAALAAYASIREG